MKGIRPAVGKLAIVGAVALPTHGYAASLSAVPPVGGTILSGAALVVGARAAGWRWGDGRDRAFASAALAADPAAPGEYVLTLACVDPAVLAFTDHPARLVANVPAGVFAAAVGRAAGDPLNATLAAPLAGGPRAMVVVVLLAVVRDAAAGTATYRVAVLAEEAGPVRAAGAPVAAPAGEQAFGPGHLFVDSPATCDPKSNVDQCPSGESCILASGVCCPSDRACPKGSGADTDHCCDEGTKCHAMGTCF